MNRKELLRRFEEICLASREMSIFDLQNPTSNYFHNPRPAPVQYEREKIKTKTTPMELKGID